MFKRKTSTSEIKHKVITEYIEINDTYSVFRSIFSKMKDSIVIQEEITEGIQKTQIILNDIENAKKTSPSNMVYVNTPEISRVIRLFGFPNFGNHTEYLNPETKELENPFGSFMAEVDRIRQDEILTLEYIEKNPSILEQLIICDYTNLESTELMTGKYVNQAIHVDRLKLNSDHVKYLTDVVDDLIKNGHLACILHGGKPTTFVPGNGTSVFGYINMSDEVFQEIIAAEKEAVERGDKNARFEQVYLQTFHNDYFGFSESYYGKAQNNPHLTRYDIEDDEY